MKTIEINLFTFDELQPAAKEKARQWFRECQEGDNYFSETVIDDAKQIAPLLGITFAMRDVPLHGGGKRQEPAILFSGFSSQGDGACFEGQWSAASVQPGKLIEYAPQDKELHGIAAEFERIAKAYPEATFTVKHSGHYSHKFCTEFDVEMFGEEIPESSENSKTEKVIDNLIKAARDFMQWIYKQLETEFSHSVSDESVDENILCNDYTFTIDGKRFDA